MDSELDSQDKTRLRRSPSFGILVIAFVVGCTAALSVTYLMNFVLDGQGSFDNAVGGIVGTFIVVVAIRLFGERREGNG